MVIGHRFLELVNLLQMELSYFGDGLDLEFIHDIPNIVAGSSLPKALLFQKCDLLLEVQQLVKKLWVGHRILQDGTERQFLVYFSSRIIEIRNGSLRDHFLGDDHVRYKLRKLPLDCLPIFEFEVHLHRLLLQGEYLRADAAQVGLE